MQELPHHYKVTAQTGVEGDVILNSNGVPSMATAGPKEYGGPGDKWSPETLLVGAVADCFSLSFKSIARASKLSWTSLTCEVEGTLEKSEGVVKFTSFTVYANLTVASETSHERAHKLLEKAEKYCLISNSLSAEVHLEAKVS